jgi:hypothetical protein
VIRERPWLVIAFALLAVVALGVAVSRPIAESYDASIMVQVTESIVEHGNVEVHNDVFGFNTPHSTYGLGLSLLMVPAAVVAKVLGADLVAAMMLTNGLLLGALGAVLIGWARLARASWRQALTVSALVVAGTSVLPLVATGFSELAVAVGVAVGLVALEGARQGRPWAGVLAGSASGFALLCRTDSLLLVVPFVAAGTWWMAARSTRVIVQFSAGFAPWFGLWAWYNQYRFGAPWRLGYKGFGFDTPFFEGLYGLTLSSGRGVLWFVPLVVVAAVGGRDAYWRAPAIALAAIGMVVARPFFYASWTAWEGGVTWGPRFLAPAMPMLAVGLLELVRRWRLRPRPVHVVLVAIVACSIGVQVIGTVVAYDVFYDEEVKPFAPPPDFDVHFHLFGWGHSPIAGEAAFLVQGHGLASRYLSPAAEPASLVALLALAVDSAALAWVIASRLAPASLVFADRSIRSTLPRSAWEGAIDQ